MIQSPRMVLLPMLYAAMTVVLLQLALLLHEATRAIRTLPDRIIELASSECQATREAALQAIAALQKDAVKEIDTTRSMLIGRADQKMDRIVSILDERTREIQRDVAAASSRATETATTATSLLEDARPAVQAWAKISPELAANTLGLVAASKVTAGQAAQTMREIQRATPDIVASIQASATASQQAAMSAAQTSQNLAIITKPGPRWLRYLGIGAAVAVPASQVAIPAVLAVK